MSNYNELRLTYQGGQQTAITLSSNIIQDSEYQYQNIVAVEVPEIVTEIGGYAFCDNSLTSITLNEGLQIINGQVFQHGTYSAITIPSTVTYIGMNAFNIEGEQDGGYAGNITITCLAATPPRLVDDEGITFGDPSKITAIYVPSGSVSSYKSAWPQYASKITDGGEPETGFTNLTMSAAYVGLESAQKIYLGNNLVWEPAPEPTDPCEELTGKARCDCEGGYWWNGGCHDSIDPMFWEPLTMVIQDPGSGSTTGLLWRLSGVSSASEVSQYGRSIYYTLNDGPLTPVQMAGTPTTSKTVDVVIATGLSQGDVFRFYGASSAVGAYGFASGSTDGPFHFFVNYAGMQAAVLGNIKSLLTDPTEWEGMVQYQDKQAIDNLPMNDRAFMNLFQGKTAFTFNEDATYHLVLPDRNLSTYCFKGLFNGCTRMTTAPELPATALTDSCYREMFLGCTSLTSAPALPAETLAANCYRSMFNGCTSLTAATTLPALSVPDSAYLSMFADCPITQAPELPATTLSPSCYQQMFRGTNITDMPDLPATTLAQYCYQGMFSACTSLTATTVLPAPTLVNYCYQSMFRRCTNLTEVTCLATDVSATNCTQYWLQNASSTGTFYKDPNMTGWGSGTGAIPTGWTVQDYVEPNP